MTSQEAFDINWNHFVVGKGKPSRNGRGGCAYRGECGTKCGVGLLIPDDKYDTTFEGVSVPSVKPLDSSYGLQQRVLLRVLSELGFANDQIGFLSKLQECHDCASASNFHTEIELSLRDLADRYGLTVPVNTETVTEYRDGSD